MLQEVQGFARGDYQQLRVISGEEWSEHHLQQHESTHIVILLRQLDLPLG
jgi:hypothetical protein